jgi:hypothetical protein
MIIIVAAGFQSPVATAKDDYQDTTKLPGVTKQNLLGMSWHPYEDEALLVGDNGVLVKFDSVENKMSLLSSGTDVQLKGVAWHPSGEYALIVGEGGTVLKYSNSGTAPLNVTIPNFSNRCHEVVWSYDGKYAAIAAGSRGILWYTHENGSFQLMEKPSSVGASVEIFDLDWRPKGIYAVGVGSKSILFKISRSGISVIDHTMGTDYSLYAVSWRVDGSSATIVGPHGSIIEYNGQEVTVSARGGAGYFNTFLSIDWREDGDYSLIGGENGVLLAYRKKNDYPYIPKTTVSAQINDVEWDRLGRTALVAGNNGIVLRYPGKVEEDNGFTFNPMVCWTIVLIAVVFTVVGFGLFLLKLRERDLRKKQYMRDRKKRRRRSKRKRAS